MENVFMIVIRRQQQASLLLLITIPRKDNFVMEQSLLQKLLCEVKGVMDKYDLNYTEDALTKIFGTWWVQQVGTNRAFT